VSFTPNVPGYVVGDPGAAASVQGRPALLAAQQPDAVIDAGTVGALTVRAASVRGTGHRYDGTPRQDDVGLGLAAEDRLLVVAVADGVSAGASSHVAARVAVRLGVQLVVEALATAVPDDIDWDALVGRIAGHVLLQARKATGDESLDAAGASRLMATTVALAIVPVDADAEGRRACVVLPIGDTSVWVLRAGDRWEPVTAVKNDGEAIASSAVLALPLLPAGPILPCRTELAADEALFVVTDGIGDPLGDGSGDVGAALATAWRSPPNRYEFAAQVDFGRRSHTDDRTVVGVWCGADAAEEPPSAPPPGSPSPVVVDLAPPPAPRPDGPAGPADTIVAADTSAPADEPAAGDDPCGSSAPGSPTVWGPPAGEPSG